MILVSPRESLSALLLPSGYLFLQLFSSISLEMKLVAMRYLIKSTTFKQTIKPVWTRISNYLYIISGMLCQTERMFSLLQAYRRDKTEETQWLSRYVYFVCPFSQFVSASIIWISICRQ